jgi:hypothetical protein
MPYSFGRQESKSDWKNYTKDISQIFVLRKQKDGMWVEQMRGDRKHIFSIMRQLQNRNPEAKYRADYVGQHRSF